LKIPFVDLKAQYESIKTEVHQAIDSVLESQAFVQGPIVKKFSEEFCKLQGVPYGVGVSNGTSAITAGLKIMGIGRGDEVILPTNTFFATAEAVAEVGALPVLCDCRFDNYSVDVESLKSKITSRTKAIIPVHLYGSPADMDALLKVCKENSLLLLEDAAQAHLAKYKGKSIGSFGEFATFSFYPGKNLGAYGDAGFISSTKGDNITKVAKYIDHGRTDKYLHDEFGVNYRMDAMQAAILGVKLKYLRDWTEKRQALAKLYDKKLKAAGFKVLENSSESPSVYHLYIVEVSNRDEVQKAMSELGIATGIHYPVPLHLQKAFANLGYKLGDLPVAEKSAHRILSLPIFPELSNGSLNFICESFLKVAKK
jgi:dTDP-4-amino-4,6-dideoxygalactose transaminase